jgi:hypothetical protein
MYHYQCYRISVTARWLEGLGKVVPIGDGHKAEIFVFMAIHAQVVRH